MLNNLKLVINSLLPTYSSFAHSFLSLTYLATLSLSRMIYEPWSLFACVWTHPGKFPLRSNSTIRWHIVAFGSPGIGVRSQPPI